MSTTLSATTPLAERAKALVPLLDSHASYADENSQLAPEVVDALLETGLLKMWVPEELGGSELGPRQSLEVLALTPRRIRRPAGCRWPRRWRSERQARTSARPPSKDLFGGDVSGDRRPGHCARHGEVGRRRLPADRFVELRFGPAARRPHPHARDHRGDRRGPHLRRPGAEGRALPRQLGRHGAPRDRQHRLHDHRRVRPRRLHPLRLHARAAARGLALQPRHHRHRRRVPLRLGHGGGAPAARRAQRAGAHEDRTSRVVGRLRRLPDQPRQDRGSIPRRGRPRQRVVGRRRGVDRGRRRSRCARTRWSASRSGTSPTRSPTWPTSSTCPGGTTALRKRSPIERLVRDVHAGTQHITSGPGMWRAAGEELVGAGEQQAVGAARPGRRRSSPPDRAAASGRRRRDQRPRPRRRRRWPR